MKYLLQTQGRPKETTDLLLELELLLYIMWWKCLKTERNGLKSLLFAEQDEFSINVLGELNRISPGKRQHPTRRLLPVPFRFVNVCGSWPSVSQIPCHPMESLTNRADKAAHNITFLVFDR
jgi:hypothetical protein